MIGYYVHHVGTGHLHRATAFAQSWPEPVTGLSSLPRPAAWNGPWIDLPRDDTHPDPHDPTAGGQLHWVPQHDRGLLARMTEICTWVRDIEPRALVVDVSVEVATLVRLLGVPVVSVIGPGRRNDPAHLLNLRLAQVSVAFWPEGMTELMLPDVPDAERARVRPLGALSRHAVHDPRTDAPAGAHDDRVRRALVLLGRGGDDLPTGWLERARAASPGWEWTAIGGSCGTWVDDPRPLLEAADVVITHAGQNALAEVAAARTPAIVVPQERPHDEQHVAAAALERAGWPVAVLADVDDADWPRLLAQTAALDGARWAEWCDGQAVARFRALMESVVRRSEQAAP